MPATLRMWSMWSATIESVAFGAGCVFRYSATAARSFSGSPAYCSCSFVEHRVFLGVVGAGHRRDEARHERHHHDRRRWPAAASGSRRARCAGDAQTARAEECEKITGARETRMASAIVSAETWLRSTSIPSRFISRTTCSPNGDSPPSDRLVGGRIGPRHVLAVRERHVARAERVHHAQRRQRRVDGVPAFHADHRRDLAGLEGPLDVVCRARQRRTCPGTSRPCGGRCRSARASRAPPLSPASSPGRRPTRTARRRRRRAAARCRSSATAAAAGCPGRSDRGPGSSRAAPTGSRCARR